MYASKSLFVLVAATVVSGVAGTPALADVPQTINHQGVVKVSGQPFEGTGHFKFAILNAAGVNVWTNDGSNLSLNGVPDTFEDVTVADGVYSVILGGTGPGYTMIAIPPTLFNEPDRRLRIWFDDGTNGPQQLTPDHSLTSSPYSQQSAFQPPIGSIIAWHKNLLGVPTLPDGWIECTNPSGSATINVVGSPLNGQVIPPLNDTPPGGYTGGGRFLRGGTSSGNLQAASTVTEFTAGDDLTSSELLNGTDGNLPASPVGWSFAVIDGPLVRTGHEAAVRPVNMSVVWIMRVK